MKNAFESMLVAHALICPSCEYHDRIATPWMALLTKHILFYLMMAKVCAGLLIGIVALLFVLFFGLVCRKETLKLTDKNPLTPFLAILVIYLFIETWL